MTASFPTRRSHGWNFTLLHSTKWYSIIVSHNQNHKAPEEQSSLAHQDTTTWLTSMDRFQGSITDILFGPSVIAIGELKQFHTWTVTGTIWLQSWDQYNRSKIYIWIHNRIIRMKLREYTHGSTKHKDWQHLGLSPIAPWSSIMCIECMY
jgi:hypothetical protein